GSVLTQHGSEIADDFAVVRLQPDGMLDATFGSGGSVTTDMNGTENAASAVAIQQDGKILVGGYGYGSNLKSLNFAVARYNSDGTLDTSFSSDGWLTPEFGDETANYGRDLAIQDHGNIVVSGNSTSASD